MTTPVRFTAPRVAPRSGHRVLRSLLAAALVASASLTQAVCLNQSSGSGQSLVKGSAVFMPLTAGITTSTTPAPDETFNWIAPAPLTFTGNGSQTPSETY